VAADKHTRFRCISFGLGVTFLFTALALPIYNSTSIGKEVRSVVLKSGDDGPNQNSQLPLAENENKEEESTTEKDQNLSPLFLVNPVEQFSFSSKQFVSYSFYTEHFVHSEVPLYLTKRTLLI